MTSVVDRFLDLLRSGYKGQVLSRVFGLKVCKFFLGTAIETLIQELILFYFLNLN
jgi:hypothetical protein